MGWHVLFERLLYEWPYGVFGSENLFKSNLAPIRRHGKSPCFLILRFLCVLDPDGLVYYRVIVNGEKYLD